MQIFNTNAKLCLQSTLLALYSNNEFNKDEDANKIV